MHLIKGWFGQVATLALLITVYGHAASGQTISSTVTIQNTTTGPNAAPINVNGASGGCVTTIGTGVSMCSTPSSPPLIQPGGTPQTYTASYKASAYNYLYQVQVEYYLDV